MQKTLLILILFTAIQWHLAWDTGKQIPGSVEVWNGEEQLETTSHSIEYNGRYYWWVMSGGEMISFIDF